ncbi:MAG TPA: phytanoyl-CoA dioxygenase family protein [Aliidongia sp.]|nr:phytanoyl-CoA dioxygenase family protein [Aliidongia sp.]
MLSGLLGAARRAMRGKPAIRFSDLAETPDPATRPPLDRPDVDPAGLSPLQCDWHRDGVVILRGFVPDHVIDPYVAVRERMGRPGGWMTPQPYEHVPELRRLSLHRPLMQVMRDLIGEEMLLHLNLTGWVSTERDWHQDDYLNPPFVNCWYAAAWIALDRITPESGPFEYIPGSHRWPLLRGERVQACMTEADHAELAAKNEAHLWPTLTQKYVVPAVEAEIAARGARSERFLAEKGDVLIWHGGLMHRGTKPAAPGIERRTLIAHYTALSHRPDLPARERDGEGSHYAVLGLPLHWPLEAPYW